MKKQTSTHEPIKFKKFKHLNATILDSLKSEHLFHAFFAFVSRSDKPALEEWTKFRKFDPLQLDAIIQTLKDIGVLINP